MYCHKCGTQNPDGAGFCIKCGAKLITEAPEQNAPASAIPQQGPITSVSQQPVQPASPPQQPAQGVQSAVSAASAMPPNKKSKKIFFILGSILLVVIIGIIVAVNWEGDVDFVATLRAYKPFDQSQGLPYSCGEVLDKYMEDANWEVTEGGNNRATVNVKGPLEGADNKADITFTLGPDPDNSKIVRIDITSVKVDDGETPSDREATWFLLALYDAYDNKVDELEELPALLLALGMQDDIELTETYANEDAGISFQYPSCWEMTTDETDFPTFTFESPYLSQFRCAMILSAAHTTQDEIDLIFGDDALFEEYYVESIAEYGNNLSIEKSSVRDFDGTPIREVFATGDEEQFVVNYIYAIYEDVYSVQFMRAGKATENLDKCFDAIMDTYTIAMPEPTPTPVPTPSPTPVPTPTATKAPNIPVVSSIDVTFRGESLVHWCQGDAAISYDIFGWPDEGTVIDGSTTSGGSKYSAYNEGVMFLIEDQSNSAGDFQFIYGIIADADAVLGNGVPLDKTQDEIKSVLGEPDEIDSELDENEALRYYLYYDLDEAVLIIESSGPYQKAHTVYITPY